MKLMNLKEGVLLALCVISVVDWSFVQARYQGDIILTPEQEKSLEINSNNKDPFAPQNAVVRNERSLWRNGRVPYVIDDSLSGNSQAIRAINQAIDDYHRLSCIRFVQRTTELDYVVFFRGRGCYSYIGRVGGPQDISIGSGCEFKGIVMHEMFHALGRWHEQSRPDRDQYVRVNFPNIQEGMESNFEITNPSFVTTQGVPYDLQSIMHYGAYAFSRNRRPTIEPVNNGINLNALGQRNGLSELDLRHVVALYCEDSNVASWSSWGAWSSCSRTCNGGTRTRTRTCVGGSSCQGSNIDTETCNAQQCPQPATWSSWGRWGSCSTSCGGGRQQRIRRCVNGNTCTGPSSQFRDCNTQNCPLPATWGPWGSWSSCSSTCQGGNRIRRRTCQNGNTCPGPDFETGFCNTNIVCVPEPSPNTGEWSRWSECTKSCGGGFRFRSRMCGTDNCESQQQECNTQDCNPEPELRGLQHIGCYYVPPRSRSIGLLEGGTEDLQDNPISRTNPIGKCGAAAQEYGYSLFAISVGYCISGSNDLRDYQVFSARGICADGRGSYYRGYFVMDVYQIANEQAFADSVVGELITTEATTNATTVDSAAFGGAPEIRASSLLLIVSILMTLISTLLFF